MADKAEKKPTRPAPRKPVAHSLSAIIAVEGGLRDDLHHRGEIGVPVPARDWIRSAVSRLKNSVDCPSRISRAARRLKPEMAEAFKHRHVDAAWSTRGIENALRDWGLWDKKKRTSKNA
jgi:hypothetical protein